MPIGLLLMLGLCLQVVHLDLKTKNILLNRERTTAKITDVGLSRVLASALGPQTLPMGTFEYAAPEVLMGTSASYKADIFGFGVICWEVRKHTLPCV